MALVFAGLGVEHDHTAVAIAVGDVNLVCIRVDPDARGATQVLGVVAATALFGSADLQQELAILRELQHVRVTRAVAADPDMALVVDVDTMLVRRPLEPVAGPTP